MSFGRIEAVQVITQDILRRRLKDAQELGINLTSTRGLMDSQTSSLQLLLKTPTKVRREGVGLLGRTDWTPTNSTLPFFAFEILALLTHGTLACCKEIPPITSLKLWYVEFMGIAFLSDHSQFLLGVFTAYGPNLFEYPTRVIQILQEKNLLRTDMGIPVFPSISRGKKFALRKLSRQLSATENGSIQHSNSVKEELENVSCCFLSILFLHSSKYFYKEFNFTGVSSSRQRTHGVSRTRFSGLDGPGGKRAHHTRRPTPDRNWLRRSIHSSRTARVIWDDWGRG